MVVCYEYHLEHKHNAETHTPAHRHAYCELVYYYVGAGSSVTKEEKFSFRGNDLILYAPEVVHDETHFAETEVFCLGFTMPDMSGFHPGFYRDPNGEIAACIGNIRRELSEKRLLHKDAVEGYIAKILILLARENNREPLSELTDSNQNEDMTRIAKFARENLHYKLTIRMLAEMSGYSYDYFRHIFGKYIGVSPKNYLKQCQIEEARRLLTQTTLNLAEISELCGFATQEHFSMFFKKNTGISPLTHRNNNRFSE